MEDKSQRQLNHHIPSMFRRFMAFYADEFLRVLFFMPFILMYKLGGGMHGLATAILVYLTFRIACLMLVGASFGKWLWGLRVVSRNGDDLEFIQAALRVFADELSVFFAFAPRALVWFRLDRTHLSDWIAETRVISIKPGQETPKLRPILGSILVLLGLFWGAQAWSSALEAAPIVIQMR